MINKRKTFITELEPVSYFINERYDGGTEERLNLCIAINRLVIDTDIEDCEHSVIHSDDNYIIYITSDYFTQDLGQHINHFCNSGRIISLIYMIHQMIAVDTHNLPSLNDCESSYVILPKN